MTRLLWDDEDPDEMVSNRTPAPSNRQPTIRVEPGKTPESPLTVTSLNARIKQAINSQLPTIWVEGEVGDLSRPSSGHIYFSLKDNQSQIRAVMWKSAAARLDFQLEDGQSLLCQGQIDVYSPRGSYQIVVQRAQPKGLGALQLAFRQLHEKLAREGLFRAERKKPLPRFPRRIGFVTSPSGAAVRDFLEVLRRRWPNVCVLVIPAKVQGPGSVQEIVRGIAVASELRPRLDVLVVGRGGGSLEDLWSFNEEAVVRAIADCTIPTVSAVGHEVDVTLCDLAADARALTPSEAAERILPNAHELYDALMRTEQRLTSILRTQIARNRRMLDSLARRSVIQNPKEITRRWAQRIDELELRCGMAIDNRLRQARLCIDHQAAALEALSPLRVMQRGYSVTRHASSHKTVTNINQLRIGDQIETLIADGTCLSRIESIDPTPPIP